jgi:carboxymethylenebutenolidase
MERRILYWLILVTGCSFAGDIETVHFESQDHKTQLVGYIFRPLEDGRHPGVVMLHGRAGPYSALAGGVYSADTLSKRHQEWGNFWAERGYIAILVDSFGPRGYPQGFPAGSYKDRPAVVSEQTVRPLDAYGALRYLRGRSDVLSDRIVVQGWSNGGMTVLVTMSDRAPGIRRPTAETGFRAAVAEYPGCEMDAIKGAYHSYAPLLMMIAADDQEVSARKCEAFARRAREAGSRLEWVVFEGAEHNFDDPGKSKQSKPANRRATEEAKRRAEAFFARALSEGR